MRDFRDALKDPKYDRKDEDSEVFKIFQDLCVTEWPEELGDCFGRSVGARTMYLACTAR